MSPLNILSRVINRFRALFTRHFPNLNLILWVWFAEACLSPTTRRIHTEVFLTSCNDFRIIGFEANSSSSQRLHNLSLWQSTSTPEGPTPTDGHGNSRGRPRHSSGAAKSPWGGGYDKSFGCNGSFGPEKCYYYPFFHWKYLLKSSVFTSSTRVIYLSKNFV